MGISCPRGVARLGVSALQLTGTKWLRAIFSGSNLVPCNYTGLTYYNLLLCDRERIQRGLKRVGSETATPLSQSHGLAAYSFIHYSQGLLFLRAGRGGVRSRMSCTYLSDVTKPSQLFRASKKTDLLLTGLVGNLGAFVASKYRAALNWDKPGAWR